MLQHTLSLLIEPTLQTIYMVILSMLIAMLAGIPLGIILYATSNRGLFSHKPTNFFVGGITNIVRSIPYIILMIAIIPFTRFIVGTSIGTNAAIVSLSLSAIPFFARVVESAFVEVPFGLIEAGLSMGASPLQIFRRFILPEAMPAIVNGVTLTLINLVGYSAMAGTIGGGGLGDLAIRYGYERFDTKIMVATIIVLVIFVQIIQSVGDRFAIHLDKR